MAKGKKKVAPTEEELMEVEEVETEYEEVEAAGEEEVNNLESFVRKYQNYLIGAAAVLLAVVGVVVYLNYSKKAKSGEARDVMFKAIQYFEQDSLTKALNGDGTYSGFEQIAEEYSGTAEANLANYYLGIIYIRQGDLETGVDHLKKFEKSDNLLSMAAYVALGFAHEDLGDPEAAASYFVKAADAVNENEHTTPMIWMHAARNYEAANQPDKAKKLYEEIKEKYPNTAEGSRIDRYLGRVSK